MIQGTGRVTCTCLSKDIEDCLSNGKEPTMGKAPVVIRSMLSLSCVTVSLHFPSTQVSDMS